MKRTNLVLDEHLLEELTRVSGERTYSRAVTKAMEDYLRRHRERRHAEIAVFAKEHAGTDLDLDGDLEEAGIEAVEAAESRGTSISEPYDRTLDGL
jgi:Bacterial antitoxin of type II TA system, VapB